MTVIAQSLLSGQTPAANLTAYSPQTGDVAATWTKQAASNENFVANGAGTAYQQDGNGGGGSGTLAYYTCSAVPAASGVVTGDLTYYVNNTPTVSEQIGLLACYTDGNNHLKILLAYVGGVVLLYVQEIVGGSTTSLVNGVTISNPAGASNYGTLRFVFDPSTSNIKLYHGPAGGTLVQQGTGGGYTVSGVPTIDHAIGLYAACFSSTTSWLITAAPGPVPGFLLDQGGGGGGATAFTLTGPSQGPVSAASANFTVTPTGGTSIGTFTPGAASGCTFTPSTLTWSGDAAAKTFTVTKTSAGTANINGTFSTGETPPANVSYTAKTTTTRTYTANGATPAVTTGFTAKNNDATKWAERTTATTDQGSGIYSIAGVVVPDDYSGIVVWDQGAVFADEGMDNRPAGGAPAGVIF